MKYDESDWKPVKRPDEVFEFRRSVHLESPPSKVFEFCRDGANFQKIFPQRITPTGDTDEIIVKPDRVFSFRQWYGVVPLRWDVHIVDYVADERFVDFQLRGPFRYFRHTHLCEPEGTGTRYTDIVEYRSYFGKWVDQTLMRRKLEKVFAHRHRAMQELLNGE